MNEKLYGVIRKCGGGALAIGIITICMGIGAGVMMIINGAKLLSAKSDTLF